MAVIINDASNFGTMPGAGRQVVRDSNGYLWTVQVDLVNHDLELWRSTDGGDTWVEQDTGDSPAAMTDALTAIAIDSNDNLHVLYQVGASGNIYYVDFSSGNWGTPANIIIFEGMGPGNPNSVDIAVDSNNVPHVVATGYDGQVSVNGNVNYKNKTGGSWQATVGIESSDLETWIGGSISINAEDIPVICAIETEAGTVLNAYLGNANNAESFTTRAIDTSVNVTADEAGCSIAVDSAGDVWVAYVDGTSDFITISKQSANWTDAWSGATSLVVGYEPSLAIVGINKYIFYTDASDNIVYTKYNVADTPDWLTPVDLQTGTLQDVKSRWALATQYDSGGNLVSGLRTYYFNDGTPIDDDDWTNDANAFNNDIANSATTETQGTKTSNYLQGDGTNAPASGGTIVGVKLRFYFDYSSGAAPYTMEATAYTSTNEELGTATDSNSGSDKWSDWSDLSIPSGGWTWNKLQNLYVRLYASTIFDDIIGVGAVQIIVQTSDSLPEIDYVFSNGTDIYWDKLDLDSTLSTDQWSIEFFDTITQTITAKANISVGAQQYTQTVEAKACINKTVTQTLTSLASIQKSFTQTLTSKGRIQLSSEQSLTSKGNVKVTLTQTIESKGAIKKSFEQTITSKGRIQIVSTQVISSLGRISLSRTQTLETKGRIQIASTQTITAKARITVIQEQTLTSKAKIICIGKTVLVTPTDLSRETSPVYLVWEIPTCCQNRNIHANVQVDKTDNTFNDLEKDVFSYRDSDFEYWDGDSWEPYPTAGVTSTYYGNEARVQITLTSHTKYWRVRGGVK